MSTGGDEDLWLVDLNDPENPVRLSDTPNRERFPSFSPDDSLLICHFSKAPGGIFAMDIFGNTNRIQRGGLLANESQLQSGALVAIAVNYSTLSH